MIPGHPILGRAPGNPPGAERVMENKFSGVIVTIKDCRIIELPKISDPRGNLTFIEGGEHIPFDIQRVYYLYDVPGGSERGGHAHKNLQQLIVAMSGSFDVVLDDGGRLTLVGLTLIELPGTKVSTDPATTTRSLIASPPISPG